MTRVHFHYGKSASNQHGTERAGEKWNREMRCGPKFVRVKLGVHAPSTGHRFIFYWPSGAWWYFDIYFDRRGGTHET